MSAVMSWLREPYIHVIVVVLVIVQFATRNSADDSHDASLEPLVCSICDDPAKPPAGHLHYVARVEKISRAQ